MSTDYLSALNAGSGLNVTQIVDALVDAERVPKQKQIDEKTEKRDAYFAEWERLEELMMEVEEETAGAAAA